MAHSSLRLTKTALFVLGSAALAAMAPGCASAGEGGDPDDDYSDQTWSALSTDDTRDAVLENASDHEDVTLPPSVLDAFTDQGETDDLDSEIDAATSAESASTAKPAAATYQNAVLESCADPGVIRVGSEYIAACTGGGYPTFTSTDLVNWKPGQHLFTPSNRPKWVSKNWWAPEIHHIGSAYVAYFSAFSPKRNKMCIGAARGPSATGPWTDIGRPLVCDKHVGLIDVTEFTDSRGKHFLYYKTDSNALRPQEHTVIYAHELGADGISFVGQRHAMIQNSLAWEGDVVEAPWVIARGKYFYMFYSGYTYCNGTYGVGVARALSPLGPFKKKGAPILHSNGTWVGPGHNSVVTAGGHDFIVYHAWKGAHACGDTGDRHLLVDRIAWKNGWPSINDGTPSRGRHTAPLSQ